MPGNADSDLVTSSEPSGQATSLPGDHATQSIQKVNGALKDDITSSQAVIKSSSSPEDVALLDSYFGIVVRQSVMKLYEKVVLHPDAKASSLGSVMSQPITDRQLRTMIHQVRDDSGFYQHAITNSSLLGHAPHLSEHLRDCI